MIFLCEAFAPNQKRKSSHFSSFVRNETFFFTFAAQNGNNLGGEKPPWDECNQALLLPQFTTEAIFWKYTRPILNVNFFRFWAPLKKTRSNKKAVALLLLFIEKEKDHLLTLLSFHTEEERRRIHSFTYFLIKLCQNKVGVIETEAEKTFGIQRGIKPGTAVSICE